MIICNHPVKPSSNSKTDAPTSNSKIPLFSLFLNYERQSSTNKETGRTSDYEKQTKFFEETKGEVFISERTCPVYKIDLDRSRPVFTRGFVTGMRDLQIAARNTSDSGSQKALR